ncbi:NADP-dependent oxidoreductase domain-containing protein [Apodospora peruviana]|uniref:NADP-dependent oxidoreductase domain-containing protein n=1 Tax=Apodospora peruviana TaxID=516989 RepID=A0AAE0ID08_9PEZI|nr:NADP-dependent oxidoreductase domain-containing protein [Apodospora peruviana]
MTIPTRSLGRNGPQVPAIGLGCMSIGAAAYGSDDQTIEDKLEVLERAWEIGARFWDTADIYIKSEDRIGDWFKNTGKRDDIFLASKFGIIFDPATGSIGLDSSPEYARGACERSLARLGVETIDLYYCHRVDGKTPIEKTMEALVQLKNENKIRHIGLSEVSAATIRRAHAVHPITAVQVEYSPFCLDIESPQQPVLETCRELGIAVVAYSPMGRGLLTGQVKSFDDLPESDFFRRNTAKSSRENFPKIMKLVEKIGTIAARHSCSTAQVCLAWVMAQGEDVIPIPGTRTIKYLEENMKALAVKLSGEELEELRRYVDEIKVDGDRYPTV